MTDDLNDLHRACAELLVPAHITGDLRESVVASNVEAMRKMVDDFAASPEGQQFREEMSAAFRAAFPHGISAADLEPMEAGAWRERRFMRAAASLQRRRRLT